VQEKYKVQLTTEIEKDIQTSVAHLDLNLILSTMKEFIINNLNDASNLGPDLHLKEILGFCTITSPDNVEEELEHVDWFRLWFPQSPLAKHCVETYKLILSMVTKL